MSIIYYGFPRKATRSRMAKPSMKVGCEACSIIFLRQSLVFLLSEPISDSMQRGCRCRFEQWYSIAPRYSRKTWRARSGVCCSISEAVKTNPELIEALTRFGGAAMTLFSRPEFCRVQRWFLCVSSQRWSAMELSTTSDQLRRTAANLSVP